MIVQRIRAVIAFALRNPSLLVGLGLLLLVILFGAIGPIFVDVELARPISVQPNLPPSRDHLLGTEALGREMLAVMVVATPQTLRIGFLAGIVALVLGTTLGLVSGYFGGMTDTIIRGFADIWLTIPALAVLLVVAAAVGNMSVSLMTLIIASLSWMWPTRAVRSQVLTLKERPFVHIARLSGYSDTRIIVEEIFPNLIPFLAASFVSVSSGAILAAIGLEVLGLGPQNTSTLGMTIYWSRSFSAMIRGMWWWWLPPIIVLIVVFVGLYLTSSGLDELANPRIRRAE